MAKAKLEEMRIRPAKNGGHHVVHHFTAAPRLAGGAMSGGMTMDHPPTQEFNFGPKDQGALMKHIASALALKSAMAGGAGATPSAGAPAPEGNGGGPPIAAD